MKAAAKEWKDTEKGIAYGLEAEKHGIDAAWELMLAYEPAENYEQALHWAKVRDSRAGNEEAAQQGHAAAQSALRLLAEDQK